MKTVAFLFCVLLALPSTLRADVTGAGRQGLRGLWHLPEAAPDPTLTSRVSFGVDYTQSDSLIYPADGSRQMRRFANVSLVPYEGFEFSYQYHMLDTRSAYNLPGDIHVRGDALFSAKWSKSFDAWSFGGLAQVNNFVGGNGAAYTGSLLGQYTWRAWDFIAQAGYMAASGRGGAPTPVQSYAYQQATRNAILARAAVALQSDNVRPFLEYGTEQYLARASSPHRLTLGAHAKAGLEGLVATPAVSFGTSGKATSDFPQEPGWRAGLLLSYAVPTRQLYEKLFPPPGSFIASVTDATNGAPIDGLILTWNGKEQSPPDGRFVHQGSAGQFVIALKADGYLPVSDTVRVIPNQLIMKSYGLQRNVGTLRGTVFLGGKPGKAQLVLADHARGYESGENGQFKVELAPGAYALTVTAPGFQPARRTFLLKYKGQVVFDRLELSPAPKPAPKPAAPEPVSAPAAPAPSLVTAPAPVPPPVAPSVVAAPEPVVPPVAPQVVSTPKLPDTPPPAEKPVIAPKKTKPAPQPPEEEVAEERERQEWLPVGTGPLPESMESPVFFPFGSWEIDPRAHIALDRLAELLKSDKSIQRLVIEGRADAMGTIKINSQIAAERADAIYRYLVSKGVERSKMATMSSFYRRKAVGQSESVRALDRRVGFRIERE